VVNVQYVRLDNAGKGRAANYLQLGPFSNRRQKLLQRWHLLNNFAHKIGHSAPTHFDSIMRVYVYAVADRTLFAAYRWRGRLRQWLPSGIHYVGLFHATDSNTAWQLKLCPIAYRKLTARLCSNGRGSRGNIAGLAVPRPALRPLAVPFRVSVPVEQACGPFAPPPHQTVREALLHTAYRQSARMQLSYAFAAVYLRHTRVPEIYLRTDSTFARKGHCRVQVFIALELS
jgi:hypothetical protein